MRIVLTGSVLCGMAQLLPAQTDSVERRYASTITQAHLREHLDILASDAYGGRETGMEGQKMAAAYIEGQFRKFGIPPVPRAADLELDTGGYQQAFPLLLTYGGGLQLSVGGTPLVFGQDYFYYGERLRENDRVKEITVIAPLLLGNLVMEGASPVVMVLDPETGKAGSAEQGSLFKRMQEAANAVKGTGIKALLLVSHDAAGMMKAQAHGLMAPRMHLGTAEELAAKSKGVQLLVITPEVAATLLAGSGMSMKKALRLCGRKRLEVRTDLHFTYTPRIKQLTGENVLGYVEGSDRQGELVVVTAHYDHIGTMDGEVYNGADDDGSGTVAVLEMAQAFMEAKAQGHGPRRSMLFMTVSGEEKGLLGSEWYTDHPVFPLDSTVANLNIDMIGRVDSAHAEAPDYVYVIGSGRISSELKQINEAENAKWTKLQLDYTFDSDSDPNRFYYRSDHYNFAKHGVPIAFYFNGVHADYHGPYDEVEKIRFDLLEKRARLVFHTAWELANRDRRIRPDAPERMGHD